MTEDDGEPHDELSVLSKTLCPYCLLPVSFREMKDGSGILSDPDIALIANWVYHSKCWDKQVEEHPP